MDADEKKDPPRIGGTFHLYSVFTWNMAPYGQRKTQPSGNPTAVMRVSGLSSVSSSRRTLSLESAALGHLRVRFLQELFQRVLKRLIGSLGLLCGRYGLHGSVILPSSVRLLTAVLRARLISLSLVSALLTRLTVSSVSSVAASVLSLIGQCLLDGEIDSFVLVNRDDLDRNLLPDGKLLLHAVHVRVRDLGNMYESRRIGSEGNERSELCNAGYFSC